MIHDLHTEYMTQALGLASQGRFSVAPNPMVGCLIVNSGKVVGKGFHQKAGESHAEVLALKAAGKLAEGATLYVTLEPCSHYGRTPPCVNAILEAGISKVVVACRDPNPLVSGQGIKALKSAGLEVIENVCQQTAEQLNEIFFHYIVHKTPFIICKWAMSLDGKTIVNTDDSKQISHRDSQLHTHDLRHSVDAILIGRQTLLFDDPLLTVRDFQENKIIHKQPIRIVLANRELPTSAKIFSNHLPGKTLVVTTNANNHKNLPAHIEVLVMPKNKMGYVDLHLLLKELGKREISSVLVEGGQHVHAQFFQENLVNKTHVYLAPVYIGTLPQKMTFAELEMKKINQDFHFIINNSKKNN